MADFGAMRTGRLVVRYHSPWRGRWFIVAVVLVALLLLYVIYEWGRFAGGYSKLGELQRRRELNSQIEALQAENDRLRADVAAAREARNVDDKAYSDVEKNLADLQAQVLKQREELTFYRGIVSPEDGIGGLKIQRFQVVSAGVEHGYKLRLVLVQSMRQDSEVAGSVRIQIEGVQDNRPVELTLDKIGGSARADGQVTFKFRYFQNLEQDVTLPPGFEPRAVTVEVRAARLAPVQESYPWQVQAEG